MTDKQGSTRKEPHVPPKGAHFAGTMEEMQGRCANMMPQMMELCCGAPDDEKEGGATDAHRME